MEFVPVYFKDKLKVINPRGYAGIVTLWTPVEDVVNGQRRVEGLEKKLRNIDPTLFNDDSPLVTISSLFGNGLPQMLANLAYNPQVERIAITGVDSQKSGQAFEGFVRGEFEDYSIGDVKLVRVKGTNYTFDPALLSGNIKPEIQKFSTSELGKLAEFVRQPQKRVYGEEDRIKIELNMPVFKDFPSDITGHNINADTPLEAWMDVMHTINRFGTNIELGKGPRRTLYNLDVNVRNPTFEYADTLKKFNFDPEQLRAYQRDILDPSDPTAPDSKDKQPYTYGHRMRAYWGSDALAQIAELFKKDKLNRHGLVSLWDTRKDLLVGESSAPCFTGAYLVNHNGKLMLTSEFRTHNATSAWFYNLYGLRAIQEEVSRMAGMEPGQINIRSRWISIDPENAKTVSALEMVKQNRKKGININDPIGYFVIDTQGEEITATHYHPQKTPLYVYRGKDALTIKDQMRQDGALIDPDHAMWIGYELARAELKIKGKLEEL